MAILRQNVCVDWSVRDSVRAKLRLMGVMYRKCYRGRRCQSAFRDNELC